MRMRSEIGKVSICVDVQCNLTRCYKRSVTKMLWKFLGMKNSSVDITTSYPEITPCRGLCPCNTYEGRRAVDGGLNVSGTCSVLSLIDLDHPPAYLIIAPRKFYKQLKGVYWDN